MPGRASSAPRILFALLGAAVLIGASADTSPAATYYVATTGSDANAGSQAAPWLTLQKAGDVAAAGDTVNVLPGTYRGFRPRKSGTAQAPVRFIAQPGVVVNQPGPANSNNDNIWVRDVDHIVIDGFESTAAGRSGVAVQGEPDGNSTGVVIRNCVCHHNSRWGIFTGFARDLVLENNETSYSAIEHGIYVSNSGDRPIVRGNHAHHNNASGIQLNADPSQLDDPNDPQSDGIITDALIERNVIHDNGTAGGAAINLASVRTSLIRNNLLYANLSTGIAGWDDGDDPDYGTRDNRILGNTIVQPANARFAVSLKNGSINNVFVDNILLHAGTRGSLEVDASSQPGLQSDYNVVVNVFSDDNDFFTLAEWRALGGWDQHSVVSNAAALFVSASDFHLSPSSPARNAGTTRADLPSDIEGTARPQGSAYDAGAYEASAAGAASPTPTSTSLPATATATRTRTATATRTNTITATRTATASPTPPAATSTRTATATAAAPATNTATPAMSGPNDVSGAVRYYRGTAPVAGAVMHLDGPAARTASSDAAGQFAFTDVSNAGWTLEPRKSGAFFNGISALDASYVLQYVSGRRVLDAAQLLACDVTGNGSLSTLDATRILQFTVGTIPEFAAATACLSDWLFMPQPTDQSLIEPSFTDGVCQRGGISYDAVPADLTNQDFAAALIGDCTGNWQIPTAGLAAGRGAATAATFVSRLRHGPGGRLRAAILIRAAEPLLAVSLRLSIDPSKLSLSRAHGALAARDALVQANDPETGSVAIAVANPEVIPAGERIAVIVDFDRLAPDARRARVSVEEIAVNE